MLNVGFIGEKLDLTIRQGATFGPVKFTMKNPDLTPVNLTGCSVYGVIRRFVKAGVSATITCTITNAALGEYEFILTHTITASLETGDTMADAKSKYVWELEWTDSLGNVHPLFYGDVIVFRQLTY